MDMLDILWAINILFFLHLLDHFYNLWDRPIGLRKDRHATSQLVGNSLLTTSIVYALPFVVDLAWEAAVVEFTHIAMRNAMLL